MDDFINKVIDTWGDAGELWLAQLPDLIETAAAKWQLSEILAYENLSYNFVAHAKRGTGTVTLKISQDKQLIADEYNALQHFFGNGVVEVLDIDREINALLLQEAVPGSSLKEYESPKLIDKISAYADVVNKIAAAPQQNLQKYTHVARWCSAIDEISSEIIPSKFVTKAKTVRDELLKNMQDEYLCHGDLHLDNIIKNANSWLAIDPKGVVAEKAFEVAAFDLLSDEELANNVNLSKRIVARNHSLATTFSIEPQKLLSWFFIRLIINAQWFIADDGDPQKSLSIAEIIYPLLKKSS